MAELRIVLSSGADLRIVGSSEADLASIADAIADGKAVELPRDWGIVNPRYIVLCSLVDEHR